MKHFLTLLFMFVGMFMYGQTNLIQDANFESADFSKAFYQTFPSVYYNQWTSFVDASLSSNTTISRTTDAERSEVGQMTNGATSIANANAWKAFISQRLEMTADAALYKFSFWAKATAGTPTARVFLKIAGGTTKYFIYDTGKPELPTSKYTAFCKNLPLTTTWQYFENVLDLSKTTTSMSSIYYSDAVAATTDDRTNFGICLQNNTANSSILFDEVEFSKVVYTKLENTSTNSKLNYKVAGNKVFVGNADGMVDVINITGRKIKSINISQNKSFDIEQKGIYILRFQNNAYKISIQ